MKYNCPDWNISTIILLDLEVAHTSCPCRKALLKIHLNYHAALQQLYKTHLMSILSSLVILWIFSLFWMFIAHVTQVVDVDYVTLYHVEHCHQKKKNTHYKEYWAGNVWLWMHLCEIVQDLFPKAHKPKGHDPVLVWSSPRGLSVLWL